MKEVQQKGYSDMKNIWKRFRTKKEIAQQMPPQESQKDLNIQSKVANLNERMAKLPDEDDTIRRLKEYAQELWAGKQNYLAAVYQMLAVADKECVRLAAFEIARYMKGLNSRRLMILDEQFRESTSMEWFIDWDKILLSDIKDKIQEKENYLWVLRLGTFHPNGYFRERCMKELAGECNSLPYLLLRLNDWAKPVRETALRIVVQENERKTTEEFIEALPYLEKVRRGSRRTPEAIDFLEQLFSERIAGGLCQIDLMKCNRYELATRKYLYRLLLEQNMLSKEEADILLNREKDGQCKYQLLVQILNHYPCTVADLEHYLSSKSSIVRQKALEQKYSMTGGYWEGAEKLLLDKSKRVRALAAYILRKHTNMDIVAYYEARLETQDKPVCILGIGENGTKEDASRIQKYLTDTDARVVKRTLLAINMLLGEKASDIYWNYLFCEQEIISKAAYRAIASNDICYGAGRIYEALLQCSAETAKQYLVRMLIQEPSWESLPYVLRLYQYEDPKLREEIRECALGRRSLYAKITKAEAEEIRGLLYEPKYKIPTNLQKVIEFDLKYVTMG